MPLPREVLPGRIYMITRRCTQRQLLLRPDSATNNAFIYCLAVAAKRSGVRVLYTVAESNHHHTGIYDPLGTYPEFIEHFHKLLAKCMNALRGRWENFWSSEQTSVLRLVDPSDILDKMVYALTGFEGLSHSEFASMLQFAIQELELVSQWGIVGEYRVNNVFVRMGQVVETRISLRISV